MIDPTAFRAGDEATFRLLVREQSGRLRALIRRYTDDDDEASDLLQQSWVAVYRSRAQFEGRGALVGWILAVCRHTCLVHARRRSAQPAFVALEPADVVTHGAADASLASAVHDAIAGLAPRERDVAILRLVEGASTREAAERLGCAEGTIKATLHRATAKLREQLKDYR